MDRIQILDKHFKLYLAEPQIQSTVSRMATVISRDYKDRNPIICPVLTGSFMFAADLLRQLTIHPQVSFVSYSSYDGMTSTGEVKERIGFPKECRGRDVVLVEDVIDTGLSMEYVIEQLKRLDPSSIAICTLLFKPGSFKRSYHIDYIGREIDDDFIVGYGIDYNDMGRDLRSIYILDE